jgi:hypothetical protein
MTLYKTIGAVAILGACLLLFSYPFRNDEHGVRWVLGGIGWSGFLLCGLTLVMLTLIALARLVHRRLTTA